MILSSFVFTRECGVWRKKKRSGGGGGGGGGEK